jgi:hypothetical protein
MRVVATLGLHSIAATAAAMLDDPATVAVIRQQSDESRHAVSQPMPTPKGFLRRPDRRFI